jgi:hypothetical protein
MGTMHERQEVGFPKKAPQDVRLTWIISSIDTGNPCDT